MAEIKVKCVENKSGNSNFTVNNIYIVSENLDAYFGKYYITSDWLHIFFDDLQVIKTNSEGMFQFASCVFQMIS